MAFKLHTVIKRSESDAALTQPEKTPLSPQYASCSNWSLILVSNSKHTTRWVIDLHACELIDSETSADGIHWVNMSFASAEKLSQNLMADGLPYSALGLALSNDIQVSNELPKWAYRRLAISLETKPTEDESDVFKAPGA